MKKRQSHLSVISPFLLFFFTVAFGFCVISAPIRAAEEEKAADKEKTAKEDPDKPKPFDKVVPDAVKIPGLITLYQKKNNLYAEITSAHLEKDYIIVMSIAKGIGNTNLYAGQSLDPGEDMIWQFRKVDDRIQIVRRNYRYQADSGTTEEKSVKITYTDSIIFSLPIIAAGPGGGDIVDLTPIFMNDLPGLSRWAIPSFSFSVDRSSWAKVKGFAENIELEVAATFSSANKANTFDGAIIDGRGLTVNIHYSISKLPESGYKPRAADERVGYFTTAIKNLNKNPDDGNFIRYINRWNLQKLEPGAKVSLPKKPILFWLDKNMPYAYRKPIRDGILEWNKAFEKAGFYNAIEVRQQEDNDTWDPEDIRYNTIRWSPANLGFAIGPSRVNPMTGEILDADIVLDVAFVNSWSTTFETFSPSETVKAFCGRSELIERVKEQNNQENNYEFLHESDQKNFSYINETLFYAQQFGVANAYFDVMSEAESAAEPVGESDSREESSSEEKSAEEKGGEEKKPETKVCPKCNKPIKPEISKEDEKAKEVNKEGKPEKPDEEKVTDDKSRYCSCERMNYDNERKKLVEQGLRWVVAHEVGHTLGLRHNFKQSTLHSLQECNNISYDAEFGYGGSAMDYMPVNIMPEGEKQGDYFPSPLGAYDYWAIKYGYKVFDGKEEEELKKIASEQAKPEYNYATDEERVLIDDPTVGVFDLGDPLEYAKMRVRLFDQILPGLDDRIVKKGESYRKLASRFYSVFTDYGYAMYTASRFVGGLEVNRDFKGDPEGRPTFVPTPAAKQREALEFVMGELFGIDQRQFSPDLLNNLAPNRWRHWGSNWYLPYDTRVEEMVLVWHQFILEELLSTEKLGRIADAEYRTGPGTDALTIAELFDKLTDAIFIELDREGAAEYTETSPAIVSVRRNLQRAFISRMSVLASGSDLGLLGALLLGTDGAANDVQALARYELQKIQGKIDRHLNNPDVKLDTYSAAHLTDLKVKLMKTLEVSVLPR